MSEKGINQSDYMALQLLEIERFRLSIAQKSRDGVSFQEAAMLWISEGHAEQFRVGYMRHRAQAEPAVA